MRHEVTHRIERHLDKQLGLWTRLLPWRREMAVHLEDAYQAARTEANEEDSWQLALTEFGDVQDVACQLRKEHWPQFLGWRIIAVIFSVWIVFSIVPPAVFLDVPAFGFTFGPLLVFIVYDICRGSARWDLASRVGTWGALCGASLGLVVLLTDVTKPTNFGACLAASIMCALYCVLFFTPRRSFVIALISIVAIEMGLLVVLMNTFIASDSPTDFDFSLGSWGSVDVSFMMQVIAICGASLCAGIARFGFHGVARHAPALGAGAILLSLLEQLRSMSDPTNLLPHLFVAFGAMVFVIAGSHCISDSSRVVRRMLS